MPKARRNSRTPARGVQARVWYGGVLTTLGAMVDDLRAVAESRGCGDPERAACHYVANFDGWADGCDHLPLGSIRPTACLATGPTA